MTNERPRRNAMVHNLYKKPFWQVSPSLMKSREEQESKPSLCAERRGTEDVLEEVRAEDEDEEDKKRANKINKGRILKRGCKR